jgi:hypothetical protein
VSDLVVVAFPTEEKAEEVRTKLLEMQREYLVELDDAIIAVKHQMAASSSISCSIRRLRGPPPVLSAAPSPTPGSRTGL